MARAGCQQDKSEGWMEKEATKAVELAKAGRSK